MSTERIWPNNSNLQEYLNDFPEHRQRYDLVRSLVKNLKCADIACGVGYGSFMMGEVAESVKGFDISNDALNHANKNFTRDNVSFHHASEFVGEKYDVITSIETLEHMNEIEGDLFLKNIANSMNPDSFMIFSTPLNETNNKLNITAFHIREYSNSELIDKLKVNGFYVEKWFGQSNIVSERMSKKVLGLSFVKILQMGLHKFIPKQVRKYIARIILKKDTLQSKNTCKIKPGDLSGAFSQIAICRLIKK
jgi:SAM-dependent methyltransferase